MNPMPGFDIRLVFTLPPRDSLHCSTKDVYTSEITFLALHPWEIVAVQFSELGTFVLDTHNHDPLIDIRCGHFLFEDAMLNLFISSIPPEPRDL